MLESAQKVHASPLTADLGKLRTYVAAPREECIECISRARPRHDVDPTFHIAEADEVWSTDWFGDPDRETGRLPDWLAAVRQAAADESAMSSG